MTDDLVVFGQEYENVTGIKATDDNGQVQTYIKPEGTINIITKGLTDVRLFATANVDTGTSVPDGGSTNQVLAKDSDTDGDVTWKTVDKTYVGLGNVDNTSDANKPISTATQTALNGKLSTSLKGANSGLAELDANGKVPTSQLPSFVDDVLEYSAQSSFPATGETGKIYIAQDTNKTYRWSGTAYVEISSSLALGTTSSTAYRGDYGNTAYAHATDSSRSTTAQASGLYKIATTAEGHVASTTAVAKSDITDLGIPAQDTTDLESMTGTLPIANGGTGKTTASAAANAILGGMSAWTATPTDDTYFIRQDTSGGLSFGRVKFSTLWTYIKNKISSVLGLTATTYGGSAAKVNNHTVAVDVPSDAVFTDTVYTHPTTSGNKHIPAGGSTGQVLKYSADGTAVWGDVGALPSSTSTNANQVLKLDSTGANPSWSGYAVPAGGYSGQVLTKSSSSAGAFYWRELNIPTLQRYMECYEAWHDYGNTYQGFYYTWEYIPEMYGSLTSGQDVWMWVGLVDSSTGETTQTAYYHIDGISDEPVTDTTLNSTYFQNDDVYFFSASRTLTDGTVETKTFEFVNEIHNVNCWMMRDVTPAASSGLPSGGSAGQVLKKNSNTDGDVGWGTISIREVPVINNNVPVGAALHREANSSNAVWERSLCEMYFWYDSARSLAANKDVYEAAAQYLTGTIVDYWLAGYRISTMYEDINGEFGSFGYATSYVTSQDENTGALLYIFVFEQPTTSGTIERKVLKFWSEENDGVTTWYAEDITAAAASIQSASGVSF